MRPRLTTSMLLAALSATPATARPARESVHDQSIGVGAQWALPHPGHGEKPGVQSSWRGWFSPRLGVGADFRWWGRTTTTEFNARAREGPESIVIPTPQGRDDRRISSYGVGIGILAREPIGRLSFIAGAGPGFFVERTSYRRRINDSNEAGGRARRSIGAHALAEVDLGATSRLSAFAALRIELRGRRVPDSSSGYPAAGVRFAF